MDCSTPGISVRHQLPKLAVESVMPSNLLVLCHPLLLPSIFPSIRLFSNESGLHIRWSKYWSFSFSISPSNEYSGLISLRIDLFDLLAVQGTLKSLLQNHSSKASILRRSAFFMVQLSYPYMTTGKTIALTRWIFVFMRHRHFFLQESPLLTDTLYPEVSCKLFSAIHRWGVRLLLLCCHLV